MSILIAQLEAQSILTLDQIKRIRHYITKKYPNDKSSRAKVLADAVHQILSRYLLCLETPLRLTVQKKVITEAVKRNAFYVNGHDLFTGIVNTYIATNHDESHDLEVVKTWLTQLYNASPWHLSLEDALKELDTYFRPLQEIGSDLIKQLEYQPTLPETVTLTSIHALPAPQRSLNQFLKEYALLICLSILTLYIAQKTPLHTTNTDTAIQPARTVAIDTVEALNLSFHLDARSDIIIIADTSIANTAIVHKPIVVKSPTVSTKRYKLAELNYRPVDINHLSIWLKNKNALLGEIAYLKIIVNTAKIHNLDPILLIAIAGQEQSFVQKTHPEARKMVNNPFNVFGSWRKYNTTLSDSTEIACRTIIRLSSGCPDHMDPVKWINRKYASDPHWGTTVRKLMRQIETAPGVLDPH